MSTLTFGGPSPLEIVFSFDTTGSMSSILEEVKGRLQDMIQRLQADIPGIRIGIIAHGDYCDKDVFYLTKQLDFTNNIKELCEFVHSVEGTGGGDQDECYEYVLRIVRTQFSWTPPKLDGMDFVNRILIVIGDAGPHEPDYHLNTDHIDWRDEYNLLCRQNVKIYGVQAMENENVDIFYKAISEGTGGKYLKLENFSSICDFLMAICYREGRGEYLMGYEAEVRSRNSTKISKDLEGMFGTLRQEMENGGAGSSKDVDMPEKSSFSRANSARSTRTLSVSEIISSFDAPLPCSPISSPTRKSTDKNNNSKVIKPKTSTTKLRNNGKMDVNPKSKLITKKKKTMKFLREKVSNSFMSLGNSQWSNWRELYSLKEPTLRMCRTWKGILPNDGKKYFSRKDIFPSVSTKTGFYEISIQTKARGKRHVVYGKVIAASDHKKMKSHNWERLLLGGGVKGSQQKYERQIRNVLCRGCRVFVRRVLFSKRQVHNLQELEHLDYAWNFDSEKSYRDVVRDGISLADLDSPLEK